MKNCVNIWQGIHGNQPCASKSYRCQSFTGKNKKCIIYIIMRLTAYKLFQNRFTYILTWRTNQSYDFGHTREGQYYMWPKRNFWWIHQVFTLSFVKETDWSIPLFRLPQILHDILHLVLGRLDLLKLDKIHPVKGGTREGLILRFCLWSLGARGIISWGVIGFVNASTSIIWREDLWEL